MSTKVEVLKVNLENEKIKRRYYDFLQGSEGYSQLTMDAIKKAIYRYEEFSAFEDFSKFNKSKATSFKKWIQEKTNNKTKKKLALSTCYHYTRNLKDFFKWLSSQAGYKSKINKNDIGYLNLSKESIRIVSSQRRLKYPSFEQVKKVTSSIVIDNELDLRDRALISFTLLSGMRASAIISLSIGCFDENTLCINQDPILGVKTKSKKHIPSILSNIDSELLSYVVKWVKYLKEEKFFGNSDALFPENKIEVDKDTNCFKSTSVEKGYWQNANSMRKIFKKRFKTVGIDYYSPHTFRHLITNLAEKKCKTAEELKAVSQNLGHERVATTFTSYGNLNTDKANEIIKNMNFNNNANDDEILFEQFKQFKQFNAMMQNQQQ